MNPQPFQTPPNWWPSRLSPGFVRATGIFRRRSLHKLGIRDIITNGGERIQQSLIDGAGVLILPNHSFHYDSYVLIESALRSGWYCHFMTAWQVFALSNLLNRHFLQRHGCFSINREGTDTKAIRQAIDILDHDSHALVIFPEGDIYHSNDRVMPFREGAAAMALKAQKRGNRPIHVYPAVLKCFYTQDPTPQLVETMNRLEHHIRWRPRPDLPLLQRIYRFGEGFLASKEIEYLGTTLTGELPDRLRSLSANILQQVRSRYGLNAATGDTVDQIRNVRSCLIREIESLRKELGESAASSPRLEQLHNDMQDMFFVTQLSSYHGNYTIEDPTIERIAETIDKFEEDVFELPAPRPRGQRQAIVQFGDRIDLSSVNMTARDLTRLAESHVQALMDRVNADRGSLSASRWE